MKRRSRHSCAADLAAQGPPSHSLANADNLTDCRQRWHWSWHWHCVLCSIDTYLYTFPVITESQGTILKLMMIEMVMMTVKLFIVHLWFDTTTGLCTLPALVWGEARRNRNISCFSIIWTKISSWFWYVELNENFGGGCDLEPWWKKWHFKKRLKNWEMRKKLHFHKTPSLLQNPNQDNFESEATVKFADC